MCLIRRQPNRKKNQSNFMLLFFKKAALPTRYFLFSCGRLLLRQINFDQHRFIIEYGAVPGVGPEMNDGSSTQRDFARRALQPA